MTYTLPSVSLYLKILFQEKIHDLKASQKSQACIISLERKQQISARDTWKTVPLLRALGTFAMSQAKMSYEGVK